MNEENTVNDIEAFDEEEIAAKRAPAVVKWLHRIADRLDALIEAGRPGDKNFYKAASDDEESYGGE